MATFTRYVLFEDFFGIYLEKVDNVVVYELLLIPDGSRDPNFLENATYQWKIYVCVYVCG